MSKNWLALMLLGCSVLSAQTTNPQGKLGPKEPIAPAKNSKDPEIDHMLHLVTTLKAEIPKIQDPAAKAAAQCNLDLWQHLLDKMISESTASNNVPKHHHHGTDAPPAPKVAVPKPAQ